MTDRTTISSALPADVAERRTVFSGDRVYRYVLWREWDMVNRSYAMFIGLNPSTADETQDDPTIRRCVNFAKSWGYGALCMTNLFAYRATDPMKMMREPECRGHLNNAWLTSCAIDAGIVIAAWGVHGKFYGREWEVCRLVKNLHCLGVTKNGSPRHPLYLSKTATPVAWTVP